MQEGISFQKNNVQGFPPWFRERQKVSWEKFLSLPQPSRRDESWRFGNLKATDISSFVAAASPTDASAIIIRSKGLSDPSAKFIVANDRLIYRENFSLPEGVLLLSLKEAAENHRELFEKHFMKRAARLGSEKFLALHEAQVQTGTFLYVPPGVTIEKPLECWHWVEGDNASIFPHTLIVADEGSQVSLMDHFCSVHETEVSFACGVNDLVLEKGAHLNYVALQKWSSQTKAFHINTTEVGQEAVSTALQVNLGGAYLRAENDSRLLGKEARSEMLSINAACNHQEIDQRTLQDHVAPGATSDLLYHNALNDQARTIFSGLIKVEEEAHETDAYQKVRNLMLSDDAEANSMPGLEILADRVRCSHGATSGELNKDELFYMMARGISRKKASELIVRGFFEVVLERFQDPVLKTYLGKILDE